MPGREPFPIAALLDSLTVSSAGARTSEDIYTAFSHWMPHGRIFGGQVVAQSLLAAAQTIPADRPAHSLHAYFLRPGDTEVPLTFAVDRLHDGRSFSTRRTQVYQQGAPILSCIVSFQHPDPQAGYQAAVAPSVPQPDSLPSVGELLAHLPNTDGAGWARERPFDIRHVGDAVYLDGDRDRTPAQAVWMRANGALPDDPRLHQAALAYASDLSILEPVLRGLGVAWATPGLKAASLDHAIWFHQAARADEWFLYVQESPFSGSSRGLSFGRFFDQTGRLIASVAQEGMVRVPPDRAHPTKEPSDD